MTKKNLIIFILFIAVLTVCGAKLLSVQSIQLECLEDKSTKTYLSNDNSFSAIQNAVKNCTIADTSMHKNKCRYKIIMEHYVGKSEYYYICLDARENIVYLIDMEDRVFIVDESDSKELFSSEAFADMYVEGIAPSMELVKKGNTLKLSKRYEWIYEKADENIYERTLRVNQNNNMLYIDNIDDYEIRFSDIPDNIVVKVYKDNKIISAAKSLKNAFDSIKEEGIYYVEVNAVWNNTIARKSFGTQTISFIADVDYEPELIVDKDFLYQGDMLPVTVYNINESETVKIICTALSGPINCYRMKNEAFCIIPTSTNTTEGEYELRCIINEGMKNEKVISKVFAIKEKIFAVQQLEIDEQVIANTQSLEAEQEFIDVVKNARSSSYDEILWKDKFIFPLDDFKITTDFGQKRYVNSDIIPVIHSGLDMAAKAGTEIKASNTGIVKVSRFLTMTGNTVVIDHGMGIFTTYYHLDSLYLMENSIVEKGNIIGTVGNTGFSTGPHLHFCISVYNDYINTYQPIKELLKK